MAELRAQGLSYYAVARRTGRSRHAVYSTLKAEGAAPARRFMTAADKGEVKRLKEEGVPRAEIARRTGWSEASVHYALQPPEPAAGLAAPERQRKAAGFDAESPLAAARVALGDRLTEKRGSFWLDRTPATLDQVMRAANEVRLGRGQPQFTNNPAWRVQKALPSTED